jgi:hypothetical protein
MSTPDNDDLVKVELSGPDGEKETPWAAPVGANLYRLDNSPFFAYDVSWQDIIEAEPDEDGFLKFVRVVEKSGNRTIRIILDPPSDKSGASQRVLDTLIEMGCSYEGLNSAYLSINIPASIDLQGVCEYLTNTQIQWEHVDPSYDQLYPDE